MTKFFPVISGSEKVKHFEYLFQKFEWERQEKERKEKERYIVQQSLYKIEQLSKFYHFYRLEKIAEELRQKKLEERRIKKLETQKKKEEEQRAREERYRRSREGKEIINGLFLGSAQVILYSFFSSSLHITYAPLQAAENEEWLRENNIQCILNVSREVRNFFEEDDKIQYKRIYISDDKEEDINQHFTEALRFIGGMQRCATSDFFVDISNRGAY